MNGYSGSGDQINDIPKQLFRKTYNHQNGKKAIEIYLNVQITLSKVRIRLMRT